MPKARITGNLHKEREVKGILIVWRESFRWGKDFLAGRTGVAAMCQIASYSSFSCFQILHQQAVIGVTVPCEASEVYKAAALFARI